jgi:hypothetical protein
MKKIFRVILIAIMVVASGTTAMAQNNGSQRLSREELATKQAQYIAQELALDEPTTNKYVETYCQYQREIWALGSRKGLNTEQRLERSQKILDLRKKYYHLYSGFLTEQQLDKAYKHEKKLLDRMGKNKNKSKGKRNNHKNRR